MDGFDIGRLTDVDFEAISKDMFEEKLGVQLEIFAPGPDGGIDLRHLASNGASTIIQCKHWIRSGRDALMSHFRNHEASKVMALAPSRYILVTSVDLTPRNKRALVSLLTPHLQSEGDIYGLREIEAELRLRPHLVRKHLRLWLSSTAVLQALLAKDIVLRSQALLDDLDETLRTYVPNASFSRAIEVLDERHVCIIAGLPGIGKTTLAHALVATHVADGYELVEISEDIDEANRAWDEERPQIYYYDDFLGQTALEEKLHKNEDARLLSFLRRVSRSSNKRFVLTTREYILAQARERYERISEADFDPLTCVLDLADYTRLIRAEILYSHIYHSSLTGRMRHAFAQPAVYKPIIEHRNFSPRLVAHSLRILAPEQLETVDAAAVVTGVLDNPRRLWEHIVLNQLDDADVWLLELLFTFQAGVPMDDLSLAWESYLERVTAGAAGIGALRRAIRVLEHTMLRIFPTPQGDRIGYHNPSIRDFMREYIAERGDVLERLVLGGRFFEQLSQLSVAMFGTYGMVPDSTNLESLRAAAGRIAPTLGLRMLELFDSQSPGRVAVSRSERYSRMLETAEKFQLVDVASRVVARLEEELTPGIEEEDDVDAVIHLVRVVHDSELPNVRALASDVLDYAIEFITEGVYGWSDTYGAYSLLLELGDIVPPARIEDLENSLDGLVRDELERWIPGEPDFVHPEIDEMLDYASRTFYTENYFPGYENASEARTARQTNVQDTSVSSQVQSLDAEDDTDARVERMFATLREVGNAG